MEDDDDVWGGSGEDLGDEELVEDVGGSDEDGTDATPLESGGDLGHAALLRGGHLGGDEVGDGVRGVVRFCEIEAEAHAGGGSGGAEAPDGVFLVGGAKVRDAAGEGEAEDVLSGAGGASALGWGAGDGANEIAEAALVLAQFGDLVALDGGVPEEKGLDLLRLPGDIDPEGHEGVFSVLAGIVAAVLPGREAGEEVGAVPVADRAAGHLEGVRAQARFGDAGGFEERAEGWTGAGEGRAEDTEGFPGRGEAEELAEGEAELGGNDAGGWGVRDEEEEKGGATVGGGGIVFAEARRGIPGLEEKDAGEALAPGLEAALLFTTDEISGVGRGLWAAGPGQPAVGVVPAGVLHGVLDGVDASVEGKGELGVDGVGEDGNEDFGAGGELGRGGKLAELYVRVCGGEGAGLPAGRFSGTGRGHQGKGLRERGTGDEAADAVFKFGGCGGLALDSRILLEAVFESSGGRVAGWARRGGMHGAQSRGVRFWPGSRNVKGGRGTEAERDEASEGRTLGHGNVSPDGDMDWRRMVRDGDKRVSGGNRRRGSKARDAADAGGISGCGGVERSNAC